MIFGNGRVEPNHAILKFFLGVCHPDIIVRFSGLYSAQLVICLHYALVIRQQLVPERHWFQLVSGSFWGDTFRNQDIFSLVVPLVLSFSLLFLWLFSHVERVRYLSVAQSTAHVLLERLF